MKNSIKTILLYSFLSIGLCINLTFADETGNSFQLPGYEKIVLDNGLTIFLMEQHEVPLIYVSLVSDAGAVYDGAKYGLASLTADGLLFGTKNYTKKEIEENLDFIGATYRTSASKEYSEIFMSFINTDLETVLPILKDIVMNPIFTEDEFEKRKKLVLSNLERAKESPSSVIRSYYDKFLFNEHVYGNPVDGTTESVTEISIDDIKEFYNTQYYPAGSAIAVVGDFKMGQMKQAISSLLKNWKVKGTTGNKIKNEKFSLTNNRLLLINKDDANETRFIIGSYGIKRSNPNFVAIRVVNTILGGRFTSWLNDELRVNRGLTYGAYSYFVPHKETGSFAISSFTKTETTVETIDAALEIVDKLHKIGLDVETLNSAKNYVKGQYPPSFETSGDLASLLTSMYIYDFDESFINDFQRNVDDLTVEKSKEIIAKYFPRENLQFVLIGKAAEIRDAVSKYGEITEKEIKDPGF